MHKFVLLMKSRLLFVLRLFIFLILNFSALYIGVSLYGDGGNSNWYIELNRAPWEPPGWVFGAAWSSIMICFAFYMSIVWKKTSQKNILILLYSIQFILNVGWNPTFFNFHYIFYGLLIIIALTILIGYILYKYWNEVKFNSILLLPYFIWLLIATSLNGYVYFNN